MAYSCTVHVKKFDEYNPQSVGKKILWFRMEAPMLSRGAYEKLSVGAKLLWFLVLAEACSSSGREVELIARTVAPRVHLHASRLRAAVHELASLEWIQVLTESGVVQQTSLRTNVRTDETDEVLIPSVLVPPRPPARRAPAVSTYRVTNEDELVKIIDVEFWNRWSLDLYDPDYVEREMTKAIVWLKANPKKAKKTPRGWIQFMANWLERGWDRSTTRGPSQQPATTSWTAMAERILAALPKGRAEDRKAVLGDEVYQLACKVGWHNIGQIPRGDFAARTLAGQLQAQWENGDAE